MVKGLVRALLLVSVMSANAEAASFASSVSQTFGFDASGVYYLTEVTFLLSPGDLFGELCFSMDVGGTSAPLLVNGGANPCNTYRLGGMSVAVKTRTYPGAAFVSAVATHQGQVVASRTWGEPPPPPPPPPSTTLRVRASVWNGTANEAFQPAAGATLPVNARVPLGAVVTLQAIDSNGVPVPATFTLGSPTLVDGIDTQALFPGVALHAYDSPAFDRGEFQGVHLGTASLTVTPSAASGFAPGVVNVVVERPLGLSDAVDLIDHDVVDAAHRTGVPPQLIRAHLAKESGGDRYAYRYGPIGAPPFSDFKGVSRDGNLRRLQPFVFYRLGTEADARDPALTEGALLADADRDARASLRIGCDQHGNGGTPIGVGGRSPNPTAQEIFRCNDRTRNWYRLTGNNETRKTRFDADSFTAQTTLAASYGLLQVMYGRAIEERWSGSSGLQNPSLLFDPPGAASSGEGELGLRCNRRAARRAQGCREARCGVPAGLLPGPHATI